MKSSLWIAHAIGALVLLSSRVHAADEPASPPAKTNAAAKPGSPLVSTVFRVPPGFVAVDPSKPSGEPTLPAGVKPMADPTAPFGRRNHDIRDYLASTGVNLPPEGEASYFPDSSVIYVRGRPEDVDQAELIVTDLGWGGVTQARVTFTLAEFDAVGDATEEAGLSWSELHKKAAASWREIESLSFLAMSGNKAKGASVAATPSPVRPVAGKPEAGSVGPLLANEHGMRCELELQIGGDGQTVDIQYTLNWRAKPGERAGLLQTNSSLWDGYPIVLQSTNAPSDGRANNKPPRRRVLILSVNLLNAGGWTTKAVRK